MSDKFIEIFENWMKGISTYDRCAILLGTNLIKGEFNYTEMKFSDIVDRALKDSPNHFRWPPPNDPITAILECTFEGDCFYVFTDYWSYKCYGEKTIEALKKYFPMEYSRGLVITIDYQIEKLKKLNSKRYFNELPHITDFLNLYEEVKNKIENPIESITNQKGIYDVKLMWKGSAAQLAYFFQELERKDWIQKPKNMIHSSQFANLLYEYFDTSFSIGSLTREVSEGSRWGDDYKEMIKIPSRDDEAEFVVPLRDEVTDVRSKTKKNKL